GVTMATGGAAPGSYPDPARRHEFRWFSGFAWSDDIADNGVPGKDALGPVPPGLLQWPGPQTVHATYPGEARPTAPALAGYGTRLGGWLIDWVLLAVVSIPVLVL